MKNKILVLGKVLDKTEQRNVNGGATGSGIGSINCLLGGVCIRYSKRCRQQICWYSPA